MRGCEWCGEHCGTDEHDLGEIVFDVQVVIREGVIDLGIEDFHEGGGRIAAEVGGHFVHFIEDEDGITVPAFFIIWMIWPGRAPM